jgi:CBS domain-containing protein
VKVKEIASSRPVVSATPEDDLALAAQVMLWAGIRHLPVVRGREVVGVLSERDILRRNGEVGAKTAAREPVTQAMRSPAVVVGPDDLLVDALSLMLQRKIGCLPVVDAHGLAGILTTSDLLRHQLDTALVHPGATLPPRLDRVMRRAPAVVTPDTEVFDAAALMSARGIRHLPVVDSEHKVVGMFSDRDMRSAVGDPKRLLSEPDARESLRSLRVGEVMSRPAVTLKQDAPFTAAVDRFLHDQIGAIPVVDETGRLVGIVSYADAISALR